MHDPLCEQPPLTIPTSTPTSPSSLFPYLSFLTFSLSPGTVVVSPCPVWFAAAVWDNWFQMQDEADILRHTIVYRLWNWDWSWDTNFHGLSWIRFYFVYSLKCSHQYSFITDILSLFVYLTCFGIWLPPSLECQMVFVWCVIISWCSWRHDHSVKLTDRSCLLPRHKFHANHAVTQIEEAGRSSITRKKCWFREDEGGHWNQKARPEDRNEGANVFSPTWSNILEGDHRMVTPSGTPADKDTSH